PHAIDLLATAAGGAWLGGRGELAGTTFRALRILCATSQLFSQDVGSISVSLLFFFKKQHRHFLQIS
ncbi:MAG: hypothetical protein QGI20_13950, partial [Verrucomicrobiota bacterium]|nr:hypothetical protein [Verrucomicrobiota bacterium]